MSNTNLQKPGDIKPYDTLVYIGRFQPFHNAHLETIKEAFKLARQVIVVVGSVNEPRTYKNPFTYKERSDMIFASVKEVVDLSPQAFRDAFYPKDGSLKGRLTIVGVENSAYNDEAWALAVQKEVAAVSFADRNNLDSTGIIGFSKDESSYYLRMFPQWDFESVQFEQKLDATQIRELYFSDKYNPAWLKGVVPEPVISFLTNFEKYEPNSGIYSQIIEERKFIEKYKQQFSTLPYPPIFVTADAVVVQSGHVLLVKRRSEPGKGLLAFPGGFVNAKNDKSVEDAAIRELFEETNIKVPEKVLRGSIKKSKVFDAVDRSARGRTITHAFFIHLDATIGELPKVKGSDDAEKAMWVPLSEVKRENLFEDHYDILCHFIGK